MIPPRLARVVARRLFPVLFAPLALGACATLPPPAIATADHPVPPALAAISDNDLPIDPAFRTGTLSNGLTYIIRRNATPAGTAVVRMDVATGSLDETDSEQGYAHFVEHMAFNGSTRVPEGEMVKLLERKGLAFGADTNAQTGFDHTTYMLDLPQNNADLLDTSLMLMRETASELLFDEEAVSRERGVVLSELREGQTYAKRNYDDQAAFLYPSARYPKRLPIGLTSTLNAATGASLRAFWARQYVPERTTVVVIGDYPVATMEAAIRKHFESWENRPAPLRPGDGTVDPKLKGQSDIYLDPALSERVTVSRHGPWLGERDTSANRRESLLRQVGYGVINRRLLSLTRIPNPPFRGAGFGTGDVFEIGRTTNLVVDSEDGKWRRALETVAAEYRRALSQGFTAAEIAEQVANIRTGQENLAAAAATRTNRTLAGAALTMVQDRILPTTPQSSLERFRAFASQITPVTVLVALKREAVELADPLIRFTGRQAPKGGIKALRSAWRSGTGGKPAAAASASSGTFAYTDFGKPGTVVSDTVEPALGIREVRFANGVRLNLKRTELEDDRIRVNVLVDGGELLNTKDRPLGTAMAANLTDGGLGKHSEDELQTILAGRSVGFVFGANGETFSMQSTTTPRDLELQLELFAATITDPGYRPEGASEYRVNSLNYFKRKDATPAGALGSALGGILSDNDPRFSILLEGEYQKLTYDTLRTAIGDRLSHGAIEVAVVGDVDEGQAIALVARTFGALPAREADFREWADRRDKPFTDNRSLRIVRHDGAANQALLRWTWPVPDASDPEIEAAFRLLDAAIGVEITDGIREQLGKAYSPSTGAALSQVYRGYGLFSISAGVDVADVAATRAAVDRILRENASRPIPADVLERAREPLLREYDNALKSNGQWLALVSRAQSRPQRIDRFLKLKDRLSDLTAADLQKLVQQYLRPEQAVTVLALPRGTAAPAK